EEEQTVRDANGKAVLDAEGKPCKESVKLERPRSFVGYVFNAEQIDGLPPLERKERTWNPVERADALLQSSGAKLEHRAQGRAFYRPSSDTITLPEKAQFAEASTYYATALHELGHWTGHESRLNRDMRGTFGSESYAREELRAEIASMMVGDVLGIGHNSDNHAAYVKSWIKALEDDPREIHRAAADAEKILDYVMGLELKHEQKQVQEEHHALDVADNAKQNILEVPESVQTGERRYLDVPYKEKNEAKKLGAKWDRQERAWYVPQRQDATAFEKWLLAPVAQAAQPLPDVAPEREAEREVPPAAAQHKTLLKDSKRIYLAVPYEEKDEAKAIGAAWDGVAKSWYIGSNCTDADKCNKWLPERVAQEQAPALPPREEFAEALRELGFKMDGEHPMMDGSPHRVALENDKAGERTGFYIGYLDGRPAGYAKNNRTDEQIHWKSSGVRITPQERNALQAENAQKMQERAETLRQTHNATAQRIIDQMSALHEATMPTPYMVTKNISVHAGVLVHGDGKTTCLPAQNVDGAIRTMQYIREDGSKRFAKNSSKEACFHPVGGMGEVLKAPALVVCEGYATA
ncbi:MAG: zincin-like metallopeptidase domain-containing protein, partial [Bilophila sp.]